MKFIKRNLPIVIGGLILISIVGILIVDKNSHPTQGPQLQKVEEAALIASHTYIQGNPKAPITLVGFMDLSNPECAEIYRAIKVFQELYPNRLRFALRHYPNTDASKDAALAAQVAGDQGKFWEYVEVLFANQQKGFDKPALLEYAKTIGLDTQKFETYLDDKTLLSDITTDAQAAEIFSAKNVPTIFLNERNCQ